LSFFDIFNLVVNYLGWLETIASGNGRPSRVKHLQDNDYLYDEDYESSGEELSLYAGCEYVKTLFDGTISSPNYPKKYSPKEKCHWTILGMSKSTFCDFCQICDKIRLKTLLNPEIPPDCYTVLTFL